MEIIADFHIHSKYSRATSQKMDLGNIYLWAKMKGIDIIATGDITHPKYFREIKENLEEKKGLFFLKDKIAPPYFILSGEISLIYKEKDKQRRIHLVIFLPTLQEVEKLNKEISRFGNLSVDGRPILNLSVKNFMELVLNISEDAIVIPAHIWTPWYGIFGSKTGYNSLKEALGDYTKYIYAIETGLSSDPPMNWRVSELDEYAIISNSDSHSLPNLGREANVLEIKEFSYFEIKKAFLNSTCRSYPNSFLPKILYTIEYFPEEGKYHYDGHRVCGIRMSPEERKKVEGICPKCGMPLTVGVMSRVDELSTRNEEEAIKFGEKYRPLFKKLVPLLEIIAEAIGTQKTSKKVFSIYEQLISKYKNEFNILLRLSNNELLKIPFRIGEGVLKVRRQDIEVLPGFDGEYGKVKIFNTQGKKKIKEQGRLF